MTLTAAQRDDPIEEGWLVVPDIVPREMSERSVRALCEFVGVVQNDSTTWTNYVKQGHGIIPLHHDQASSARVQAPATAGSAACRAR